MQSTTTTTTTTTTGPVLRTPPQKPPPAIPSPPPFLHLSKPLQDFSHLSLLNNNNITPTTTNDNDNTNNSAAIASSYSWDNVSQQLLKITDNLIHIIPIHHTPMSMMTSDEEFDSMVDKSHPPVPVVVYVVDCFFVPQSLCDFKIEKAKLSPNRSKLVMYDHNKRILLYNVEDQLLLPSQDQSSNENVAAAASTTTKRSAVIVTCKDPNDRVLAVYWMNDSHLLLVLTTSIQIMSVRTTVVTNPPASSSASPTTSTILQSKTVKKVPLNIRFHVYSPEHGLLLIALEGDDSGLIPFKVLDLVRLNRFQVIPSVPMEPCVQENEVKLVTLYGKCWCVHVSIYRREMSIYKMNPDNNFVKLRVFNVYNQGMPHITVVDSLLILNHSEDKLSTAYDIFAKQDAPVSPPMSIGFGNNDPSTTVLYSPNWLILNPNYIADLDNGLIYELTIRIEQMPVSIRNKSDLIKFLFRRTSSKMVLLKKVKTFITDHKETLRSISSIFKLVNRYYLSVLIKRDSDRMKRQSIPPPNQDSPYRSRTLFSSLSDASLSDAGNVSPTRVSASQTDESNTVSSIGYPIVEQMDMYMHVFNPLDEECTGEGSFKDGSVTTTELIALVVEYIRSLRVCGIPIQHLLQKFLIDLLVKNDDYHLLHQYIQYKVIDDTIPVAWQILHISAQYEPAYQIALDMMSRLQAYENICEILISRKEVSQALQLMYRHRISNIPHRVILEIVVAMNDPTLFYNTMEILTKCNIRNRGTSVFTQEDKCEEFVDLYNKMFGRIH